MSRLHLIWLGPLVTVAAVISYFMVFAKIPALRDFPWLNLPLALLGVALSLAGLFGAFGQGRRLPSKVFGVFGTLLSVGFLGLFGYYVFVMSYQMPTGETAAGISRIENFSLQTHRGEPFDLASLEGRKVVLVFYRGYW